MLFLYNRMMHQVNYSLTMFDGSANFASRDCSDRHDDFVRNSERTFAM